MNIRYTRAGGWWARLNQFRVAFGNRQIVVADTLAGAEVDLGIDGYPAGWLDAHTLLGSEIIEPNSRRLWTWTDQRDKTLLGQFEGLQSIHASHNHWAAWDTSNQIWYDGNVIASGYHSMRHDGEWIAARCISEDYALHVFYQGRLERKIPKLVEVYDWAVLGVGPEQGLVIYGYPRVIAAYPGGAQKDITRSPGGEGSTGGTGMVLATLDDTTWAWTSGMIAAGAWGVIGGPVGDLNVLAFNIECGGLDVQGHGKQWEFAAYTAKGFLQVGVEWADAPRAPITISYPVPKRPDVPTIDRPLWFGYYKQFSVQYGDNPSAPANATMIEDRSKLEVELGVVAAPEIVEARSNLIGIYANGRDEDLNANALAIRAAHPELDYVPIWGCFDGGQTLPTVEFPNVEVLGIECYVGSEETAVQCQARVESYLATLPTSRQIFLIGQSYTSNTNNTTDPQQLLNAQVIPANIAKADSRVVGILMFSDGRPTGTRDHEEWRGLHEEILRGIPGTPPKPRPPLPPDPPVPTPPRPSWWIRLLRWLGFRP